MKTLDAFVTDQRLVACLCRKRVELARRNRRRAFVSRAAGVHRQVAPEELTGLLPPRRIWPHVLRRERATAADLPAAKAKRLERFVLQELANPERRVWTRRLRSFLDECRVRILSWTEGESIAPDRYIAAPKAKPGSKMKYRVLAPYSLRDSIADSVFAAYLRQLVDARLDEHCYAFRLPRGVTGPRTHHDAVSDLRAFAASHRNSRLWVAECDIRGFFDSVSHAVTRRELDGLLAEAGPPDTRLLSFLESFLAGYDYREARARSREQLQRKNILEPDIYDPTKALSEARLPVRRGSRIGIPQGSALSGVLANVVLTRADRALQASLAAHQSTFYARYVDDIIVVSTNRRIARKAINAYRRGLRGLELPDHRPEAIDVESVTTTRSYWKAKSKKPYRWSFHGRPGVEWIGFLGYQLTRDGTLRVRRSSIGKELAKQRRVVDDIIRTIDKKRLDALKDGCTHTIPRLRRIRYAAMMHLISIGVGYPSQSLVWPAPNGVCWASGFRLLRQGKRDLSLLRTLDRGRGSVLRVLTARLCSLTQLSGIEELRERHARAKFSIKRDGNPLSYYAQFASNPRTPLVE